MLIKRSRAIVLLVGERSQKLRKSYFNSDREALAGDVVSVLGVEVAPSRKIPRFSREIETGDFGGAAHPQKHAYREGIGALWRREDARHFSRRMSSE